MTAFTACYSCQAALKFRNTSVNALRAHRYFPTPTLRQNSAILHLEQNGLIGLHKFWPYDTSKSLNTIQCFFGSFFRRAISVSSGVFVRTYPSLLEIRCTCVSTAMPDF